MSGTITNKIYNLSAVTAKTRCAWVAPRANQIGCCVSLCSEWAQVPERPRIRGANSAHLFCKLELIALVLGSANVPVLTHHCFSVSHSLGKRYFVVHAEYASEQVLGSLCAPAGLVTGTAANNPVMLATITEYLRMLNSSITHCAGFRPD